MKSSSKTPRITLVTGGLKLGGSTTFLLNMACGLQAEEIDFQIISLEKENPMKSDFLRFKHKLIVLDQHKFIFEDLIFRALTAIRNFKPTHVVACLGPGSLEVLRYIPAYIGKIAMIQSDDPGPYQAIRQYEKHFNAIAAVSLEIIAKLKKDENLSKKQIGDVRYGVSIPACHGSSGRSPLNRQKVKILYCGRIVDEQKRIFTLPLILEGLDGQRINYEFSLIGDGPDLPLLRKIIKPWIQQKRVFLFGKMDQKTVRKVMRQQDIFLLFSAYEGLPLSLLEAMAHGLIPVVSDLGKDFRALIRGTGGKLVPPNKPTKYASAIGKILRQSRNWKKTASKLCRKRIEKGFNNQAMVRRWSNFLRRVKNSNSENVGWPRLVDVRPPMSHEGRLFYKPQFRPLRRLLKLIHEVIRYICRR